MSLCDIIVLAIVALVVVGFLTTALRAARQRRLRSAPVVQVPQPTPRDTHRAATATPRCTHRTQANRSGTLTIHEVRVDAHGELERLEWSLGPEPSRGLAATRPRVDAFGELLSNGGS